MQGIGAALLLPGSLAIIVAVYPDRAQQARALGIWDAISSFALPAGPLLGGLLITADGWRTVFLINLTVVAAALVAVPLLVAPGGRARTVTWIHPGWCWPRSRWAPPCSP
jgi:DHA2 family methylenomycin A resistance protein-like MFS transporter